MNQIDTLLTLIAQKHLGIEDALEAAFKAGAAFGAAHPKATEAEIARD